MLVYFYPKADTPGCTKQACGLRDVLGDIGDTAVLGISPDKPSKQLKFAEKYGLGFPLLSDPDHAVAEAFGVWKEKKKYGRKYMGIERSAFLIDEKGKIAAGLVQDQPRRHAQEPARRAGVTVPDRDLPAPVDVIPHRPPFLFVDERHGPGAGRVGDRARGGSTGDEWFFAGHFPGRPTLPGVLMCEAIAQVGAIAVLTDERFAGKLPLFGGLDGARFRRQVGPGDDARRCEVELGRMSARAGKGSGRRPRSTASSPASCDLLFVLVDVDARRGAWAPMRWTRRMRVRMRQARVGDDHAAVVAAEAEVVRHRRAGLPLAGVAGDEVDAEVDDLRVGGRRDQAVLERQQHGGGLEGAGGAERVAGDALGRGDRRTVVRRRPWRPPRPRRRR